MFTSKDGTTPNYLRLRLFVVVVVLDGLDLLGVVRVVSNCGRLGAGHDGVRTGDLQTAPDHGATALGVKERRPRLLGFPGSAVSLSISFLD